MQIVVHDYSGHPFQVELSRALARRGHAVSHWYCSSYQSGKGSLTAVCDDPREFSIIALSMGSVFERYAPWKRLRQEVAYGQLLADRLLRAKPDIAVLCNTPLLAHAIAARTCHRNNIPTVFWQQDIYSEAIAKAVGRHIGGLFEWPFSRIVGHLEATVARRSNAIIAISERFLPTLRRWRVRDRTVIIPNWAPVTEIMPRSKDNAWARDHNLSTRKVVMYAGTLGIKHNPNLLLRLASAMSAMDSDCCVVVISEGRGRSWLEDHKGQALQKHLILLDYQPFDAFPDVLASADVLVAVLEPSAGSYSVPSKILSYLCCGRPVVAVVPEANDAARTLTSSGGGMVIPPQHEEEAVRRILDLLSDQWLRNKMGAAGRRYAEQQFDIGRISQRFENILSRAAAGPLTGEGDAR